jgi:glycosyltransferase involved in cell wall biosynthesis
VTVGLPTFNRRNALERAVRSVLDQDYRPLTIRVADNASTDDTGPLLTSLAKAHPELQVVTNSRNLGPTANFRIALPSDSDGFFMWLGDDDWLGHGCISACVRALEADGDLVLAAPTVRYHGQDRSWVDPPVELVDDSPLSRVLDYFRAVGANGVFYGLVRSQAIAEVPPLSNAMGGDWLHVAGLAFLGKVRTLDSCELHRSVGGATRSLRHVARHQGLGWVTRFAPQVVIAWTVLADLGWRSDVYVVLGRSRRLWLGLRCAAIICRRFLPGAIAKGVRQLTARADGTQVHGQEVLP